MKKNILVVLLATLLAATGCANAQKQRKASAASEPEAAAATLPKVYFFKEISSDNLVKIYEALGREAKGKVAVKLSTGEPGGHNFLQPSLIKALVQKVNGTIVECNTAYGGGRADTESHLKAAADHGFTAIAPVVIMDAEGEVELPVEGGKHLKFDIVGKDFLNYDFTIILSHFKGHDMGGFGGAIKNKPFTTENARRLGESIRKIKEQTSGSILITTSRRTGAEAENIIKKEIEGIPAYTYWWGEKKDNPIMGFWALADNIIATGDSVSMPCECCGSGKPVLLFTGEGWLTPKHERFVKSLIDGGYAVHIDAPDALSFRPQKTLNPAGIIAEKIDAL